MVSRPISSKPTAQFHSHLTRLNRNSILFSAWLGQLDPQGQGMAMTPPLNLSLSGTPELPQSTGYTRNDAALAVDGEFGILEGRTFALIHPVVMISLFFFTLWTGYLGWQWRRVRTIQEEINDLKKQVKSTPVAPEGKPVEGEAAPSSSSSVELKIQQLTEERKELLKGSYRDRHYNAGSILLGFGVLEAVGGGLNTWIRTGKLFPGPHLFAGTAITVLWALSAALVPSMQKGSESARSLHIAFNTLNVLLFISQLPTGILLVVDKTEALTIAEKVETGVSGVWQHAAALVFEQDAEAEQNGETNGSTRVEQHAEAERAEWKRRFQAVTFEQDAEAERAAGRTGSEASEQRRSRRTGGGSTRAVEERGTAGERGLHGRNTTQIRRGWSATQIEDLRIEEWPNGEWWLNTGLWGFGILSFTFF
ncbi:hypothetical protein PIB30_025763 [Stylosanthes scabra]|uniref:Uncharacterized protein n=1 Tax=Stylosanthes scabra TaxID=79078 RepID=A0ABU6RAG8_9FABA|nr:hypothetical protein [Stylosanthes scabra]